MKNKITHTLLEYCISMAQRAAHNCFCQGSALLNFAASGRYANISHQVSHQVDKLESVQIYGAAKSQNNEQTSNWLWSGGSNTQARSTVSWPDHMSALWASQHWPLVAFLVSADLCSLALNLSFIYLIYFLELILISLAFSLFLILFYVLNVIYKLNLSLVDWRPAQQPLSFLHVGSNVTCLRCKTAYWWDSEVLSVY